MTSATSESSDAELISAVRSGDNGAYGELFSRHRDAAVRMARQLMPGPDADDLVAEAFERVMTVVRAGKGPDEFFRAYLLSSIRRLHIDRIRAAKRVRPTGDEAELDRVVRFVDPVEMTFEQNAAADAFASLPERWQLVLWHLDVEKQKPAQIAPLLGLTPNSVSALAYRAREGLRLAYLQGHLAPPRDDNCRWTTSHLGQYVRKALSKRDTATVEDHLDTCSRCSALCLELAEVNSNLPGLLAPIVLGTAATGYLSSGGAAAAAGTFGQVVDWLAKPFRAAGKVGPVGGTIVAAVAVTAVSAVAFTQVLANDEPKASAPIVAPTRSGDTGTPAPGPESVAPTTPTPTPSTTASGLPFTPRPTRGVPPSATTPTAPPPAVTPTTAPTAPPPGPTTTDYRITLTPTREDLPYQRRVSAAVAVVAGDTPRANPLTVTLTIAGDRGNIHYRGASTGGWTCDAPAFNQPMSTLTCTVTQSGAVIPKIEVSFFGCDPEVVGRIVSGRNADPESSNDSATHSFEPYYPHPKPPEAPSCEEPTIP